VYQPQSNNGINPKNVLVQQIAKRRLGTTSAVPTVPATPPAMQGIFPNPDTTMQETLQRIAGLRNQLGIQ